MNRFKSLLAFLCLAVASLANAQVSDSTAIAGVSGAAPTLDCGAGQVKVGSSCAIIFQNGVTENAACTQVGDITLGATAAKLLLSCQGGVWKKAGGSISTSDFPSCTFPAGRRSPARTVPHGWAEQQNPTGSATTGFNVCTLTCISGLVVTTCEFTPIWTNPG